MFKKILSIVGIIVFVFLLIAIPVLAVDTWTVYFPINVTDITNTSRTYYPVMAGVTGQNFIDTGYMLSTGLDTRMKVSTSTEQYSVATQDIPFVVNSLPALGTVESDFYNGYSPAQANLPLVTGYKGSIQTADNAALEPGNNFSINLDGYFDTSASQVFKYVFDKPAALMLTVPSTGNLQAIMHAVANTTLTQNVGAAVSDLYTGGPIRMGQKYDAFPGGTLTSMSFWLGKNGTPTGLAYATVRKQSDDSLIGVIGSFDVSTLGGVGPTQVTFTTTPIEVPATDVRFLIEYQGGDLAANNLIFYEDNADVCTGEFTYYTTGYTNNAAFDARFEIVYKAYGVTATKAAVSGTHTIIVSADGANLSLSVDGVAQLAALGGATTNDNANAWQWMSTVTPYLNYIKETVGGVELVAYQPTSLLTTGTTASSTQFPYVINSNNNTNASGTSHTINLPANIGTGNMLLAIIGITGNPTLTWPTGWTSLFTTAEGVDNTLGAAYKVATSSDGTSVSVTSSVAGTSSAQSYTIANYQGVPVAGVAATGAAGANPNPPALTSGFGVVNTLWFAVAEDSVIITSAPLNYGFNIYNGTTPYLSTAIRNLSAASDNPGVFTAGAGNWVANTIAIETRNPSAVVNNDAGGLYPGTMTLGYNYGLKVNYGAMVSSVSSNLSLSSGITAVVPSAPMPAEWFGTSSGLAGLPLYASVNDLATQTGIPVRTLYMFLVIGFAIGVFLFLFGMTRSVLISLFGLDGVLLFGSAQTIVPVWMVFVISILIIGIMYLFSRLQMGG